MAAYTLEYADGRITEIVADDDTSAELAALACLGDDAVAAEQWDADGHDDDGCRCERLLLWASEEDAEGDDGARAVASLTAVRWARTRGMV
jgi:hypothetical protein